MAVDVSNRCCSSFNTVIRSFVRSFFLSLSNLFDNTCIAYATSAISRSRLISISSDFLLFLSVRTRDSYGKYTVNPRSVPCVMFMFVSSLSIYLHVSLNDINGGGDGRNQLPNYGRQAAQRGAPAPKAHFLKRCYSCQFFDEFINSISIANNKSALKTVFRLAFNYSVYQQSGNSTDLQEMNR